MSSNVRQKMVEGASQVLARRGLHATAFSEVLALTGTSRGSIYHHFPGGKAELIEAVLDDYGARLDDELQALHGQPAEAVVQGAIDIWRQRLLRADCDAGCPVAAVTVAADSNRLVEDCRHAFEQWQATLAAALKAAGVDGAQAQAFAALLVAAVQGGTLLARAQGQIAPFETVAGQLAAQAARLRGI
ncbi:MAG: TetR/AcrR family transcriptional regulator [Pseudomonadota bacterium]|nr:TetR/AcrR family transcriptional regulator [Pseudomonadota bacterium]